MLQRAVPISILLAGLALPLWAEENVAAFQSLAYLPPDVLVGGAARIDDLGATWDRWMGFVEKLQSPEERAELQKGLEKSREELGFGIREDLLPRFRGEMAFGVSLDSLDAVMGFGAMPSPAGAEEVLDGLVFVVGVDDPQRLDALLEAALAEAGDVSRERAGKLGEADLWRIRMGEEEGKHVFLHYTYHRGRLLAGFSEKALRDAAGRYATGPALGGSSDFLRVRSHLPREITGIGYMNLPAIAEKVRTAGFVQLAAASSPEHQRMLQEMLAPEMVPFGMAWATAKVEGGVVRTVYGPDTLLGRLPLGGSGAGIPIIAAIAVPNLLNAIQRGKGKRTVTDMRTIGTAVESFAIDESRYPVQEELAPVAGIAGQLEPTYVRALPRRDAWGNAFHYWSDGKSYLVVGPSGDGELDKGLGGYRAMKGFQPIPAHEEGRDLVYGNGAFLQGPE